MGASAVLTGLGIGLNILGGLSDKRDAERQARLQGEYDQAKAEVDFLNADLTELAGEYNYILSRVNADNLRETGYQVLELGEMMGDLAYEASLIEANRTLRYGRRLLGQQVVNYGKSGVTMEGTPTEVVAETAGEIALDAWIIEFGGRVEQWEIMANSTIQADQMFRQADITELAGEFDLDISKFSADIGRNYAQLNYDYAGKAQQAQISAARTNFFFDVGSTILGGMKASPELFGLTLGR